MLSGERVFGGLDHDQGNDGSSRHTSLAQGVGVGVGEKIAALADEPEEA